LNAERASGGDRLGLGRSLAVAAGALQLDVSPEQSARLIEFVELLFHWNRTYNLTAIGDLSGMLTHHVVDSLAAVRPLRRELAGRTRARVLDVGSGGGLPGIVLAVMQPQTVVTCIDSVGKKTAFIQQAAASLNLTNVRVEHNRVEEVTGERFDVITSRAFASLADFTRPTARLLADAGLWMAMKGKIPNEEIANLPAEVNVFHVEPLLVPGLRGERCLVWMRSAPNEGIWGVPVNFQK
jgi:16S rRNA (guanine527-N7)-methyltransferase